jgi:hypothetical protein
MDEPSIERSMKVALDSLPAPQKWPELPEIRPPSPAVSNRWRRSLTGVVAVAIAAVGMISVVIAFNAETSRPDRSEPGGVSVGKAAPSPTISPSPDTECTPTRADSELRHTEVGRWMLLLLHRVGGPGGFDVTDSSVVEQHQEFLLDLPAYSGLYTVYVLPDAPEPENSPLDDPPIARAGRFAIHGGWTGPQGFQSFIAATPEVWVNLKVNPLKERMSMEAVVQWYTRISREMESVPPPACLPQPRTE